MSFELSEERGLLVDSLQNWLRREYTHDHWRAIAAGDGQRSAKAWAQFAEMGWLAAALPSEYDGLGGDSEDHLLIGREFGAALVLEPYFSTVVVGAGLVQQAGSEAQRQELLPQVGAGTLKLAFAYAEQDSRFTLHRVATRAVKGATGITLSGRKVAVWDAPSADRLIVLARTAGADDDTGGLGLFLVDAKAPGLTATPFQLLDRRRGAHLQFDQVPVLAVLGDPEGALPAVDVVADRALAYLAGEACGAMRAVTEQTVEYLKQRTQFGQRLAEFQVLRHRVVDMHVAIESAEALARHAAAAQAHEPRARALASAAAKVQAGRSGVFVGQQAVQLHGGMGMTDELAIGHYFKRLTLLDIAFGNADHHQARYAALGNARAHRPGT